MKIAPTVTDIDALRKYPAADILVRQSESWLASVGSRPFFLWLHLMDPHAPYYPPNQAFRELTGRDINPERSRYLNEYWNRSNLTASRLKSKRDEVVQLYDAGIRWVDRQIARLVEILKQSAVWDNCVFALTADHGEEFLEHRGRFHAPVHLYEELVRVPLLIRVPGERLQSEPGSEPQRPDLPSSPMSLLHLAPTLLDTMGVSIPPAFRGRSLWSNFQQGTAWFDPAIIECAYGCTNPLRFEDRNAPTLLGVRDDRFKLVMRMEPGAMEHLYDLEADPAEMHRVMKPLAHQERKELLLAARCYLQQQASGQDETLRLRSRLREIRSQLLTSNS